MTFGEKLQKLRKGKNLSQEQLATQIFVSRQALSKWELGTATPDTENVIQISKLFGVSIDYLLNDECDNEISAVRNTNEALPAKYNGTLHIVTGSIISCLAAVGLLLLGILSSIYPTYITYPIEVGKGDETIIVESGLPGFLKLHNIGWLFAFLIMLGLIGLVVIIYPKLSAIYKKHKAR